MTRLHIAGGVYLEVCHFPQWRQLFGSGGRAASALGDLIDTVELTTCIGPTDRPDLEALGTMFGFKSQSHDISETVVFEYFHGLSVPRISPSTAQLSKSKLKVEADAVLRFGMIDADCVVHGERVVYDPQSPSAPERFEKNGSSAKSLSIVLNHGEGRLLTSLAEPKDIVASLLSSTPSMAAVVLKRGADGAMVGTPDGRIESIPAYETARVFPIGSGDIFTGVYAALWTSGAADAAKAARFASLAAAYYCALRSLPIPPSDLALRTALPNLRELSTRSGEAKPKCYLAGPFFTIAQRWFIQEARMALESQGLDVFSPYHEVGVGEAGRVVPKDLEAIDGSDIVFAVMNGLDSGTLFEVGYARSKGKPVVAFAEAETDQDLKLVQGSGCHIEQDFTTAIYRTNWVAYDR